MYLVTITNFQDNFNLASFQNNFNLACLTLPLLTAKLHSLNVKE